MAEIMTSCITCGVLIPLGTSRCKAHGGGSWSGKPRNRQLEYRTPEYRRNRKIVLAREPHCHWGFKGCTGRSTSADHVIPVAQGGTNELENLVGACGRCNALRGSSLGGTVTKLRRERQRG